MPPSLPALGYTLYPESMGESVGELIGIAAESIE